MIPVTRHGRSSFHREISCGAFRTCLGDVADEGRCCGSAGIYNITHRERSMKILEAKVAAIDKTAAICPHQSRLFHATVEGSAEQPWSLSHISQVLRLSLEAVKPKQG
jgi:glycolate oxidase iron-sulfur subunit